MNRENDTLSINLIDVRVVGDTRTDLGYEAKIQLAVVDPADERRRCIPPPSR